MDLSKAFDTIDHKLLLEKLDMFFGVRNEEKMWFQAYLENRLLRVISGHPSSSWLVPRLGVPQGSIIGPLLFVMFVNDLPTVISRSSVNMYPDDTTLCTFSVPVLVRQGPPENQLSAQEASLLK